MPEPDTEERIPGQSVYQNHLYGDHWQTLGPWIQQALS